MPPKTGFTQQDALLEGVLSSGPRFSYERHALMQMQERLITRQDVRAALYTGRVYGVELAYETEERWRIEGLDVDGHKLAVVIEAIQDGAETVVIITTFAPTRR